MTFQDILNAINSDIVANGQNEITADVLRPILVSLLGFTADQVGDLEDLETSAQANAVAAINEVRSMISSGSQTQPVVPVIDAEASFTLVRGQNRGIFNLGADNGGTLTVTVPENSPGGIAAAIPISVGMYFDLFQNDENIAPQINIAQGVVVYIEADDSLEFKGVHSGFRLIKIDLDTWRAFRLTRNGGPFVEAVTGASLPGVDADKYTNGSIGIREENPGFALDVKGDYNQIYEHADGTKVIVHAGDAPLADIGVPAGLNKVAVMEMRNHPDFPAGQMYTFAGDSEAITGFKFTAGSGIVDLTPGTLDAARVIAFTDNLDVDEKHAQLRALTPLGDFAGIDSTNKDEITGEPKSEITASSPTKRSDIIHNPYGWEVKTGRYKLQEYGAPFPFVEGYDHGDGEILGAPIRMLAIDSAGFIQTVEDFFELKVTLTPAQLAGIFAAPLELIPAPGADKYIYPIDGFYKYNFDTAGYDDDYDLVFRVGTVGLGNGPVGEQALDLSSTNDFMGTLAMRVPVSRTILPNQALNVTSLDTIVPAGSLSTLDLTIRFRIVE